MRNIDRMIVLPNASAFAIYKKLHIFESELILELDSFDKNNPKSLATYVNVDTNEEITKAEHILIEFQRLLQDIDPDANISKQKG